MDMNHLKDQALHWVPRPLRQPLLVASEAFSRWSHDGGPQLGASIAFYTIFSLAPLLVISIFVAGTVFGPDAARGQIVGQIEGLIGRESAQSVQTMIEAAWRHPGGLWATVAGLVTLLLGATAVFAQMHEALNTVGHVKAKAAGLGTMVRVRLVAFALVLGLGFLAIASLLLSAVVSGVADYLAELLPWLAVVISLSDLAVSVLVLTLAFYGLLRWLPDEPTSKRATWIAALTTSLLFTVGKTLIGMYLGRASVASSYGAAGSFVVVLLWVYYSSQILLYGAAVGRVLDEWRARRGPPAGQPLASSGGTARASASSPS